MLKILIADDHAIVRKGLIQILSIEESLDIPFIDEAENAGELMSMIMKNNYNIIILDISLPDKSGVEAMKDIKSVNPKVPILILSSHSEEEYAIRCLKAGASGYICKGKNPEEIVTAIRAISNGKKYYSMEVADMLLDMDRNQFPHESLSNREYEIMKMLAMGKTQKDIAEELYLSIKTVNTYKRRVLEKLNVHNYNELMKYCISHDLL